MSEQPWLSDHRLRVATAFGQVMLFGSFIFYAGITYERLNGLDTRVSQHYDEECHGEACIRLTRLETEVTNMASAVNRLVGRMERQYHETP